MTSIDSIFGPASNAARASNKPNDQLGQDDFIRLMVAQLENQDPTKPLENTEFLGQMAQFSMVSGIDDLGSSFEGLVNNLFSSQAMMAAQLVDRQVLVDAGTTSDVVYVQGEELEGAFVAEATTTDTVISIYDTSGNLVNSINMGKVEAGTHQFTWNGHTKTGEEAAPGRYLIRTEGYIDGAKFRLPMQQYSDVVSVSVDRQTSTVKLHLASGDNINFSQVNEFK